METRAGEGESIRCCLQDLIASISPSDALTDEGLHGMAERLADVLLHSLSLDFVFRRVKRVSEDGVLEIARVAGQPEITAQAAIIGRVLAPWLPVADSHLPSTWPTRGSRLKGAH